MLQYCALNGHQLYVIATYLGEGDENIQPTGNKQVARTRQQRKKF